MDRRASVVKQLERHAAVGQVEIGVTVASHDHVITGPEGPRGSVASLVIHDGAGVERKHTATAVHGCPIEHVNSHVSAVVEFQPFSSRPCSVVVSVGVGHDLVQAHVR